MTQLKCNRCDNFVNIPGSKHGFDRCDYCAVKNWGRKNLIEIKDVSENTLAQIMKTVEDLSPDDIKFFNEWKKSKKPDTPAPPKPIDVPVYDNNKDVIGWLIVHSPGKSPVQYDLKLGENHIGDERGASSGKLNVPVGGDKYVSRFHAILHIRKIKENIYSYSITDNNKNISGNKSTNGTFINGNTVRITEEQEIALKDGDAIQVGETTLRLKTIQFAKNADDAKTQVLDMKHEKTVIIDNDKTKLIN